jgi:hypothetical protein
MRAKFSPLFLLSRPVSLEAVDRQEKVRVLILLIFKRMGDRILLTVPLFLLVRGEVWGRTLI